MGTGEGDNVRVVERRHEVSGLFRDVLPDMFLNRIENPGTRYAHIVITPITISRRVVKETISIEFSDEGEAVSATPALTEEDVHVNEFAIRLTRESADNLIDVLQSAVKRLSEADEKNSDSQSSGPPEVSSSDV